LVASKPLLAKLHLSVGHVFSVDRFSNVDLIGGLFFSLNQFVIVTSILALGSISFRVKGIRKSIRIAKRRLANQTLIMVLAMLRLACYLGTEYIITGTVTNRAVK